MPRIKYGGQDATTLELVESKDLIAVRSRSGRSLLAGPVPTRAAESLDKMDFLFSFPEAGVEIYRRSSSAPKSATLEKLKRELSSVEDTRFAGTVLVDKVSKEPVIYTENLFVKFTDDVDEQHCQMIIGEVGLTIKRQLGYARNAYFVEAPEGTGQTVFDISLSLLDREDVELCHPEVVRHKRKRQVFDQQWHLKSTTIGTTPINASANVEAALAITQGENMVIAVIDDGVDIDHNEFSSPAKIVAPRDVGRDSSNPRPRYWNDDHGTACAGVACADGNFGASGVAPKAKLMPIRNVTALGSQSEADAFYWAADHGADVISCSWGPRDGKWWDPNDPVHNAFVPLPDSTRLAIEYAVNNGRNGKGCVICWAAGNGNESVENDGYARFDKVLAIAACNDRGARSIYSDFGKSIFCAFPSSDQALPQANHPAPLTPGIWTTDRSQVSGYNDGDIRSGDADGDYTNSFGGTSSATPGAAGVAALILSIDPSLQWDEVKDVMRRSCEKIDPQNGNYVNGRSDLYGYGRLNAETAARLAAPQPLTDSVVISGNYAEPIRDFEKSTVELSVGDDRVLDGIKVEIDISHTYIGDLTVKLIPPSGSGVSAITLHNRTGRGTNDIRRRYDANSVRELNRLVGKSAFGTWKLQVLDSARRDQGQIRSLSLVLDYSSSRNTRGLETKSKANSDSKSNGKQKVAAGQKTTRRKRKSG